MTEPTTVAAKAGQIRPVRRLSTRRLSRITGRILASFGALGGALAVLTVTSGAVFTDLESITGNTLSTGTIIVNATPASAAFNVQDLQPGDEVTAELTAANTGSHPFRYAVTSETTEDTLAGELVLSVRENVTDCATANWDATGTQLYQGPLGDTTTPGGLPIFGDAATGSDAGDRVLGASAVETLCFHVRLPEASTIQNASTTATFNFIAEQTTNN